MATPSAQNINRTAPLPAKKEEGHRILADSSQIKALKDRIKGLKTPEAHRTTHTSYEERQKALADYQKRPIQRIAVKMPGQPAEIDPARIAFHAAVDQAPKAKLTDIVRYIIAPTLAEAGV